MLRTNLATRPFYNERAVRVGVGAAIVLVAALTAFNVLQVLSLDARNSETAARADAAESETARYQQEARAITQALSAGTVSIVNQAAQEANLLIERRVFSWTELFNRFENTLPENVRVSAVEPQVDTAGRMLLSMTVVARRVEDLNDFMDQLELAGGVTEVIARQDETLDDGTLRAVIQGYYVPLAPASGAPATSEPGGASGAEPPRASVEAPREEPR